MKLAQLALQILPLPPMGIGLLGTVVLLGASALLIVLLITMVAVHGGPSPFVRAKKARQKVTHTMKRLAYQQMFLLSRLSAVNSFRHGSGSRRQFPFRQDGDPVWHLVSRRQSQRQAEIEVMCQPLRHTWGERAAHAQCSDHF